MEKALEILKRVSTQCEANENFMGYAYEANKVDKLIDEAIAELEEAMKQRMCKWKQCTSEYDTSWEGTCGAKWTIEHGTPKENVVNFCPQCGGKLIEIEPKDNA